MVLIHIVQVHNGIVNRTMILYHLPSDKIQRRRGWACPCCIICIDCGVNLLLGIHQTTGSNNWVHELVAVGHELPHDWHVGTNKNRWHRRITLHASTTNMEKELNSCLYPHPQKRSAMAQLHDFSALGIGSKMIEHTYIQRIMPN